MTTFASYEATTVLEVFEEKHGWVVVKVDEGGYGDGAVEAESYEPREDYHLLIIDLYY